MERIVPFLMLALLAGASCAWNPSQLPLPFKLVPDPSPWALASDQPAYFVVTEKTWQAHYPAPPAGADFQANFYVVASWGMQPNPGYMIYIREMDSVGRWVLVRLSLEEPPPFLVYPQVIVHPLAVAEVRKDALRQHGLLIFTFSDQEGKQLVELETDVS